MKTLTLQNTHSNAPNRGGQEEWLISFQETLREFPFIANLHAEQQDQSSKTEEATETRKRKARQDGEVYQSQELTQAFLLIFVMSSVALMGSYFYKSLSEYIISFVANPNLVVLDVNSTARVLIRSATFFAVMFAPVALIALVTVILGTMLQTKFMISVKLLRLNPKKLIPSFKNFMERTIFSRTQVINTAKTFLKFIVSIVILVIFFISRFDDFVILFRMDLYEAFVQTTLYAYEIMMYLGVFLLFLAVPDWVIQRFEFFRRLRMTQEEVRRELKDLEGNPLIKQRQKERARQIASTQMLENVETADVIITNPTHFACAILYEVDKMDAPKLVAKGLDHLALKIREHAQKHDIPLIENKPLARALYYKVKINEYLPKEFYTIVAEILSKIDKFKK